jgi:hypothetical protein
VSEAAATRETKTVDATSAQYSPGLPLALYLAQRFLSHLV